MSNNTELIAKIRSVHDALAQQGYTGLEALTGISDALEAADAEIARIREVIAEITFYAEDFQIPSESDDDWVHADDILSILAKATPTTEETK